MSDTNYDAAYNAGLTASDIRHIGDGWFAVLPDGANVHDLSLFFENPMRKSGAIRLDNADSLVAYVNDHKGEGTRIFADTENVKLTAIFDHHQASVAGWREHSAAYECPLSEEWKTWTGNDRHVMSQAEFAEFMEDNLPDIAEPAGAVLLEVCSNLKAKQTVEFHQGVTLANGAVQFTYQEKLDGSGAKKGNFQVPEQFTLGLSPFRNGEAYKISARLRWRIDNSEKRLKFFYILDRPHKIIENAFGEVVAKVAEKTKSTVLLGADG